MSMNIIMKSEDLFTVPREVQVKYDNGTPTYKIVQCSINLYYEFLMKHHYYESFKDKKKYKPSLIEFIDPNDKCNRLDREELAKKQGILRTIFKGRPLPDLSLVQKIKWRIIDGQRNECTILAVNDGGHRSRTVLKFKLGLFMTSSDTTFISERGREQNIGHMYYREIEEKYPEAIEQFEDYYLLLCIQWNLNAKQRKEDFDDRNKVTPAIKQEGRNAHDDNTLADAARNVVRIVEGEENPNPVHPLFEGNASVVLGFANKEMRYDEIVAKIMKMVYNETALAPVDQSDLNEFYLLGSYAGTDNGDLYANPKRFDKILKDTYMVLDFLYGVLKEWPQKIYPKHEGLVHALLRWYFQYTTDLKKENATFIYNSNIKIDYKVFAKKFAVHIMKKNEDDTKTFKIWTPKTVERSKADVFKGFLGQFNSELKTQKSIVWIMEDFYSVVTDIEHEADFGITTYDNREVFKQKDIVNRWFALDEKDDLGNSIDVDDARGDHDIPRSWGRLKGGITCFETNMRILHYNDNSDKSDLMTFDEYVEHLEQNDKKAA